MFEKTGSNAFQGGGQREYLLCKLVENFQVSELLYFEKVLVYLTKLHICFRNLKVLYLCKLFIKMYFVSTLFLSQPPGLPASAFFPRDSRGSNNLI